MSAHSHSPLRQQLRALEAQLHGQWQAQLGAAPHGLAEYRAAWLDTFDAEHQIISRQDLVAAWSRGQPALLSDFHSLSSSARGLSDWLNLVSCSRPVHVTLELLPRELHVAADATASIGELRLVDGRYIADALPNLAACLRANQASLGGAWINAKPRMRDASAAFDWQLRHNQDPSRFELMFFGDWHCAAAHLPHELNKLGAEPTVLHQSPAPLWEHCDAQDGETGIQLGNGHYAWMATPLIAECSTHQQDEGASNAFDAEAASELIEVIAHGLSSILNLPSAIDTVEVISGAQLDPPELQRKWQSFHRSLPPSLRTSLPAEQAPQGCIIHPNRAALWASQAPSWNDLVECAAESVIRSGEWLSSARDLTVRLALRRCLALAWNPFLRVRTQESILRQFTLCPPGTGSSPQGKRLPAWLQQSILSEQIAAEWVSNAELSAKDLRTVLENGRHAFIWRAALSTIRGTSRSAS